MLCSDLFEASPENDLDRVRYAQRMVGKISTYITQKTENTPLKDCGFQNVMTKNDELWMFSVTDAGIPYQDVNFAIGWRTSDSNHHTNAYVTTGRDGSNKFTLLVYLMDHDPSNDTDLGYKMNWSNLIHEFIHVMDYRRGYAIHKDNITRAAYRAGPKFGGYGIGKSLSHYMNSPIEFNAYYQQGSERILNHLVRASLKTKKFKTFDYAFRSSVLRDFNTFRAEYFTDFNYEWIRSMTPDTKKQFLKRLYQFFKITKDQWPDMKVIRDITDENERIDQEWEAKDAAKLAA